MSEETTPKYDYAFGAPAAPKVYEDEINMTQAQALVSNLTPMRFRTLVVQGKVPGAQKNANGHWRFSRKTIEEWAATRQKGARTSAPAGKVLFKGAFSAEEATQIAELFPNAGLVPLHLQTDEKRAQQKAYRAQRNAKLKAEKLALAQKFEAERAARTPAGEEQEVAAPARPRK